MAGEDANTELFRLVEAYYPALNQRDVDAVLRLFTEDAEYLPFNVSVVEGGSYQGHAGIRKFFEDAADTWESLQAEPEVYKAKGDQVVVTGRLRCRGKQSGIDVDSPAAWVFTFRDRKATRMRVYLDPEEALRTVGLQAEDDQDGP
jgi:ketosteroid isomerase-like protein